MSGASLLTGRAGHWTLDPDRSSVALAHKAMWGLVPVKGTFATISGRADVGADGSVTATVAVDAASINTKNKKRDTHLRSDDFFNVEKHPAITYTVTEAAVGADGALTVQGSLEVIGQRRAVTLSAALREISDDDVVLSTEVIIDRADFGMDWNRIGMLQGMATLKVTAAFTRAGAQ